MSNWINIEKEDICIDEKEGEINFYVNSDDAGANYAVLNIEDLKSILKKLNIK